MRKISSLFITGFVILCFCFSLFAACGSQQERKKKESPLKTKVEAGKLTAKLEKEIPELMEKGLIPGLSITLIRDGKISWTRGFGVQDTKTGKPVTEKTVFEAASLSKPVFAYGVLKLVEKGVMDLDKPLMQYVTEDYVKEKISETIVEDERLQQITARMVLTHSCGFPNWRRGDLKILFKPGERFRYSGEGFVFLQRVVEKMTGKKLEDFMRETVLNPLGMTDSSYVWEKRFDEQGAAAHKYLESSGQRKGSQGNAAASLRTTSADYARFVLSIMNDQGLKKETIGEMLKPHSKPEKTESIFWGLGIGLQHTDQGKAYWHWGDNGNFKAFFTAFKKEKLGVVYFANCYSGLSTAEDLVQLAIGGEHPVISSKLMEYDRWDSFPVRMVRLFLKKGFDGVLKKIETIKKDPAPKEKISEKALQRLGSALQDAGDKEAAIKIFQMNLESHPKSFAAHKDLGRAFLEKYDLEKAKRCYKKALTLNKEKKFDTGPVNWAMAFIKGLESPLPLPEDHLKTLAGDYGDRHITLKDGSLYYFRESNTRIKEPRKLFPIATDTFVMKGFIFFRLRFVFDEKGQVTKVVGISESGGQDESPRDPSS